jgi:hypothetical protein
VCVLFVRNELEVEVVDHDSDEELEFVACEEAAGAHAGAAAERHEMVSQLAALVVELLLLGALLEARVARNVERAGPLPLLEHEVLLTRDPRRREPGGAGRC